MKLALDTTKLIKLLIVALAVMVGIVLTAVFIGCSETPLPTLSADTEPIEVFWVEKRVVDTVLWQFDWSRGVAVRIPVDELPWIGHIVVTEREWAIQYVDLLEGTPEQPLDRAVMISPGTPEARYEMLCALGTIRDSVDTSKDYCVEIRLHSESRASAEKMVREIRSGRGIVFVRHELYEPDPMNEEMHL